jgi:hypothetical protein
MNSEAAINEPAENEEPSSNPQPTILPGFSFHSTSSANHPTKVTLIHDQRFIQRLLVSFIGRSGLIPKALAEKLGVQRQNIDQYLGGRRRPGLLWFIKFVELCGGRVIVEFPEGRR